MTKSKLPAPSAGAKNVVDMATAIGGTFLAACFPKFAPAFAASIPALQYVVNRRVEKARDIMIETLRKGDLGILTDKQIDELVPMGYRFMEAARQGEYEHNLRILAAFLNGELKATIPDAPNFSRMVRRIEGLTIRDLKVLAAATTAFDMGVEFVCASSFSEEELGENYFHIRESLSELGTRGLLLPEGNARSGMTDACFLSTDAMYDLKEKADEALKEAVE